MEEFRNILRTCPHCGKDFYPKRHNQRFDYPSCRVAFHNNINNKIRRARSRIDKRLHKNNSILIEVMKNKDQESFHKEFLIGKGYSFNVMTHYVMYEGSNRNAIYNFIIIPDSSRVYVIRIKND